ncbi:hypothetical protein M0811_03700 [Anaeramoeba ignava]|uniref:Uncharacterized protein n=1 Tax=Anaeramoeba ignava TaxID=1746090 RepID=A0A9Q0RGM1_ANAIG|nr:hypothetical protein M0811_03700 [Anaeramoeba ignava]
MIQNLMKLNQLKFSNEESIYLYRIFIVKMESFKKKFKYKNEREAKDDNDYSKILIHIHLIFKLKRYIETKSSIKITKLYRGFRTRKILKSCKNHYFRIFEEFPNKIKREFDFEKKEYQAIETSNSRLNIQRYILQQPKELQKNEFKTIIN